MKLYATTTSERASKGQGGKDYILTVLTVEIDGQRQEIASMSIMNTKNNFYNFEYVLPDGTHNIIKVSKGKKKKGECNHFIVKDDYGKEYCQECGKYSNLS